MRLDPNGRRHAVLLDGMTPLPLSHRRRPTVHPELLRLALGEQPARNLASCARKINARNRPTEPWHALVLDIPSSEGAMTLAVGPEGPRVFTREDSGAWVARDPRALDLPTALEDAGFDVTDVRRAITRTLAAVSSSPSSVHWTWELLPEVPKGWE